MRQIINGVISVVLLLTSIVIFAAPHEGYNHDSVQGLPPTLQVMDIRASATIKGVSSSAAYMTIKNETHKDVKILSFSSPIAKKTELHTTEMSNGMMRMKRIDNLIIKSGDTLELKPGGHHLMLMGLKNPIGANSEVPVTITFSNGKQQTIIAYGVEEMNELHMTH